jgi:IS4 transposase
MVLSDLAREFVRKAPFAFAVRAVFEHAFNDSFLDELFRKQAHIQYERDLLFSSVVDLMCAVVLRGQKSIRTAFKARERDNPVGVSLTAVYDKLNGLEPQISAAVVSETARRLVPVVDAVGARKPPLIPGRRVKILDGNHFSATEHRLQVLRDLKDGPLPGEVLAVLDPELDLAIDVIPCEDGHAQERSMTDALLARADPLDCFIADRNFCTTRILFGLAKRKASFIVRQHAQNVRCRLVGEPCVSGRIATGVVSEQGATLTDDDGKKLRVRRITLKLDKPTRDGETELHLLTNLPKKLVSPQRVAELYKERWQVEGLFNDLTMALRCEVNTLGYPRAALLAFCLALATYNIMSSVRAAVRREHGAEKEEQLSEYDLANEIGGAAEGMMIALPPPTWVVFRTSTTKAFATFLRDCMRPVRIDLYRKSVRGPKKPRPPRRSFSRTSNHVSTYRLLLAAKAAKAATKSP